MLEYRLLEPKHIKNTLYCCYSLLLIRIFTFYIFIFALPFFILLFDICFPFAPHQLALRACPPRRLARHESRVTAPGLARRSVWWAPRHARTNAQAPFSKTAQNV